MRLIVLSLLLTLPLLASARMYQWVNPASGRIELSGTPPAWYRTESGGPRVQVFENGQMVDDTAIALSASQSEKLREAAFEEFELRRQAERVKRLEKAARREAARRQARGEEPADVASEPGTQEAETTAQSPVEELPDVLDQSTIDRLKDLIQDWDKQLSGN